MLKNGNQHNTKQPTMIPIVFAAFVSILNFLTCNSENLKKRKLPQKFSWYLTCDLIFLLVNEVSLFLKLSDGLERPCVPALSISLFFVLFYCYLKYMFYHD